MYSKLRSDRRRVQGRGKVDSTGEEVYELRVDPEEVEPSTKAAPPGFLALTTRVAAWIHSDTGLCVPLLREQDGKQGHG
jgi:hypothetical protein